MRYKLLGRSGLRVSELCLGAMAFGEEWGWGASKEEAGRIIDTFAEAGGNFIDTADKYTNGTSERYVGELIGPTRDRWVLSTKFTLSRDVTDPNGAGNHRKSLRTALDASLERLQTDYVDLLWVHMWDYQTPVAEVMRALDDEVRRGRILYAGISNAPAWVVAQANTYAEFHGWTPFVAYQAEYSLIQRTTEREIIPMSQALDLAVVAWSPLGAGVLTGKYSGGAGSDNGDGRLATHTSMGDRYLNERSLAAAAAVAEIAGQLGATPAQVALAWLISRPGVTIPVIGARTQAQIADNLAAIDVSLDDSQLARLDEVTQIKLGYPHEFIVYARGDSFTFGDAYAMTDDHRALHSGRPAG